MNHAKFCLATQAWSTPEWSKPCALLRRRFLTKQEEDHAMAFRAIPLRRGPAAKSAAKLTV
jgi:hypothetical protein